VVLPHGHLRTHTTWWPDIASRWTLPTQSSKRAMAERAQPRSCGISTMSAPQWWGAWPSCARSVFGRWWIFRMLSGDSLSWMAFPSSSIWSDSTRRSSGDGGTGGFSSQTEKPAERVISADPDASYQTPAPAETERKTMPISRPLYRTSCTVCARTTGRDWVSIESMRRLNRIVLRSSHFYCEAYVEPGPRIAAPGSRSERGCGPEHRAYTGDR
jgi:hypothetical protein